MEIRKNRIKQVLAEGKIACVVAGINDSDEIDLFGPSGFDGVWLEGEHGPVGPAELGDLTRACDLWGMTPIVRVNRNDQALIYRTLDRGAMGIVVPHVNSAAEAENIVQGGKFSPIGQRGLFTGRQGFGVSDYPKKANAETLFIALIEDVVAVKALDEILAVEHIDVFFVAPSDLAASMGHIGDLTHLEVKMTVESTLSRISDSGRIAGTITSTEAMEHHIDNGARFLLTDKKNWIAAAAAEFLRRADRH